MKNTAKLILSLVCVLLTVILIILVRFVDVAPLGPDGAGIGLSHFNRFIFELFGVNMIWYEITDWLGIVAVLTAFVFAVIGFVQMIKRKSLLKVDISIIILGVLYLVLLGLYILFEFRIVNYRPIIMPGCTRSEASFPSSHTMLVCTVMGSAIMLIPNYIRNKTLRRALVAVCAGIIGITIVGRLISGVHWFTDIIGGMLISSALLAMYSFTLSYLVKKQALHSCQSKDDNNEKYVDKSDER